MQDSWISRKILLIAGVVSLSACLQVFSDQFIYWRVDIFSEFWRLWTGHWVHVGWIHFALNMLAFICLPFIFPHVRVWHFVALLLALPLFISLSFYYVLPEVDAYAGLSGVLHGLFTSIALVHLRYPQERKFAIWVLMLILIKLSWENTLGGTRIAEMIGSPVLVEAHLFGVIWGGVLALIYWLVMKVLNR